MPAAVAWGQVVNGVKQYPLHRGQHDVLTHTARFRAAIAGTGGGKTAIGPVWLMQQILRVIASGRDLHAEPIQLFVVAPTYPIMARATAPTLVRAFAGTDLEGTWVPTRNRYFLPNNLGEIWLLSADNEDGLEGGQLDGAWIDEGGQISYKAWVAIQGRLGLRQAPALITTTPYVQNWLFHQFLKRRRDGDADYYVRQWTSITNPAYPRAEYERAKRTMSPQRFAMRYNGEFVKLAGLVFPDFDACIVDPYDPPPGRMFGGMDFGWNDPFAALAGVLDADDVLHVWYERYKRNTFLSQHSAALPKGVTWSADPSSPGSIAELRRADHVVRKNETREIMIGVDAINARIYSGRLRVQRTCRAVIAEAGEYRFPEKDEETHGDKPVGGFDHALDALRYLVTLVDHHRLAKTPVKASDAEAELHERELRLQQTDPSDGEWP